VSLHIRMRGTVERGVIEEVGRLLSQCRIVPGELARVRIYRNFASYSNSDLSRIIEPSPDRIEPAFPSRRCARDVQSQHIDIVRQRAMKTGAGAGTIRTPRRIVARGIPRRPRCDRDGGRCIVISIEDHPPSRCTGPEEGASEGA
jgi:hypothetical protein